MTDTRYDVVGIGNAVVDVLVHADDDFLSTEGLNKGAMTLVDADQAKALYDKLGPAVESSGGSVANSIAGIASLGGRAAFMGRVAADQLGEVFGHDIRSLGVEYATPPSADGAPTARCLVLVTPDAQRTMLTFLGACVEFGPDDLDRDMIQASQVSYLEGYLWDPPNGRAAFVEAAKQAHAAGREVALSLSDPFCVDRHRQGFREFVENHVDILFANEEEIISLYEADGFDDALQHVRHKCKVAALTRSEKGSVVVSGDEVHVADACPIKKLVDTTGAGDAYAAGFLYAYTQSGDLMQAAKTGGAAAAEVIQHMGARPDRPLKDAVRDYLGAA